MKKIFPKLLIIVLLLSLCSCKAIVDEKEESKIAESTSKETTNITSESREDTGEEEDKIDLSDFLLADDSLKSPKREYGTEEYININAGDILAYIAYPKGDLKDLDKVCKDWAEKTLKSFQEEGIGGNLVISYNSYIVNKKYAVVEFSGEFYSPNYAHPISISAAFNANIESGKVLKIDDFLKSEEVIRLRKYVMESKKLEEQFVDDKLLENFIILSDGIEIVLGKGKYLPESDGLVKVFASYDMLKNGNEKANKEESSDRKDKEKTLDDKKQENLSKVKTGEKVVKNVEASKDKKLIAITFDDGPGKHTDRLLNILKENNVKATFFVLGSQIGGHQDLLLRMVEEGHEIGGHSWTHRSFKTLSEAELTKEIMQTRAEIASITGVDALAVRPPYGAYDDNVKALGKKLGVYFVNWDVDPLDWKTRSANNTYNEILKNSRNGSIILSHDIHVSTVDAMERLIPKLIEEGYEFVTVSDLLTIGHGEINAGKVYFSMNN